MLPFSPVRRFMKQLGAEIVARDAVHYLNDYLEVKARSIASESLEIVRHTDRKKITKEDLLFVINKSYKNIIKSSKIHLEPSFLAFSPMRNLMKQENCDIVSKEAVSLMNVFIEICMEVIIKKALNLLSHIGTRKKITKEDMEFVIKDVFKETSTPDVTIKTVVKTISKEKTKRKTKRDSKECRFCGNPCSPNAKMCPKCGDPFD